MSLEKETAYMEITDELVGLAKKAKSAEEIKSLAKDKGYDISDDED